MRLLRVSVLAWLLLTACSGGDGGSSGGGSEDGGTGGSATACDSASGRLLEVGPGKTYATPSAAAAASLNGDVIRIDAGHYIGDVATWTRANLTICGIGGTAHLYANGASTGARAIWVAAGNNMLVENIAFHNASAPAKNGAGILIEENVSITVRGSGFFDNEDGILGGGGTGNIVIERSEFARNGHGDGFSHALYIGHVNSLTVRQSFFHSTKIGHNLKSRAKINIIENSYFMDGTNGTASYQVEFPNGGEVFLRGNLIQKGPGADNSTSVSFGAEGIGVWPTNAMTLRHNTIVSTYMGGNFIYANSHIQSLVLAANLFAGSANLLSGLSTTSPVFRQQDSYTTGADNVPGATSLDNANFWPTSGILADLALATLPTAQYMQDAPAPLSARAIDASTRMIGALQAAP